MKFSIFVFLAVFSAELYAESVWFEIYELATGKLVAKGERHYSHDDIVVKTYSANGISVTEKYLELEHGYRVGARLVDQRELTGFGLLAKKTDADFSWEWYSRKSGQIYTKLHGGNLARIRSSGLPLFEKLEAVEFLSDTKLNFRLGGPNNEESHEVVVKKGSVLRFD